jgi:Holliday junction resolvase
MNSRNKGKRGELEVAHLLQKHGYDARRGQQFSGANGDADVVGLPGIHIEVKRVEKLNVENAMDQSIRDAKEGEKPAVFHRKDRRKWLVTMPFDEWIEMYEAWAKEKK